MFSMRSIGLVIGLVLLWTDYLVKGDTCPESKGLLHRVGDTKYYIIQDFAQRDHFCTHEEGYEECKSFGLKMAKVKTMLAWAVMGRKLEQLVQENQVKDTFYWLDAVYDAQKEQYFWGNDKGDGEVTFSNFFYRKSRPTGLSSFVNFEGVYVVNKNIRQCLMVSLPWPGPWDDDSKGIVYGHQTMIDERPCNSEKTRHVMCETDIKECHFSSNDAFILTEDKTAYFEQGNWIFGNRKYIVNWQQRKINESRKYCAGLGLQLFQPTGHEEALIPFLKMWSRDITTSQFWTDLTFVVDKPGKLGEFRNSSGAVVFKDEGIVEFEETLTRSQKLDLTFCVSMTHIYEFKSQMACPGNNSLPCSWSSIQYVPVNCENSLGTICQHPDANNREIVWPSKYITDVDTALNETATIKFGFDDNTETLRSRYKQTFGSLVCPTNYRMLRQQNIKWSERPTGKDVYNYDYQETYWVVDDGKFDKNIDSMCTISESADAEGFSRTLKQVRCDSWHFYLCERVDIVVKPWKGDNINWPEKMVWDKGPQRRPYPILK